MRLMHQILILLFVSLAFESQGQQDMAEPLSIRNFLQLVRQHHPLVKQAELIPQTADASTLAARGGFDPKLFYEYRNKFFDDKNYYALSNGGFTIPTWFGVEVKGGYEQNQGDYLNPENTVPDQGLVYAQVSIPLLKGLLVDERRATLQKAKLFREMSNFEKITVINEVLYTAAKAYWDWYLAYVNLQVHTYAEQLSRERLAGMRTTFLLGDRPAIDTVEANIQWQDRIITREQALMDYRTKTLKLSTFLWLDQDVPIELTDQTIPDLSAGLDVDETIFNLNVAQMDSLVRIHPALQPYQYKLEQLRIEEKLMRDKLKPGVNLIYSPLYDLQNTDAAIFNNYKWGVSVGFPLFLRKERGDLQMTRIKIENTTLENNTKRIELLNKIKTAINEFNGYRTQVATYRGNVDNYEQLWRAEQRLFDSGEGSLFMINSREMSYIQARIKLNEMTNKSRIAALDTEYAYGLLHTQYP